MKWPRLAGRWKYLVDGIRGRLVHPTTEAPDRDQEATENLEREIEHAHDMTVGHPPDREFRP